MSDMIYLATDHIHACAVHEPNVFPALVALVVVGVLIGRFGIPLIDKMIRGE